MTSWDHKLDVHQCYPKRDLSAIDLVTLIHNSILDRRRRERTGVMAESGHPSTASRFRPLEDVQ